MDAKPRIFLGSSGKQAKLLQAVTRGLEDVARTRRFGWVDIPSATMLNLYAIVYAASGETFRAHGDLAWAERADSIATAIDGHAMARQGRGAAALTTAAVGSFVAGTLATIALTFFAPPLAALALRFGPAEYFALTIVAFAAVTVLLGDSLVR